MSQPSQPWKPGIWRLLGFYAQLKRYHERDWEHQIGCQRGHDQPHRLTDGLECPPPCERKEGDR